MYVNSYMEDGGQTGDANKLATIKKSKNQLAAARPRSTTATVIVNGITTLSMAR